MTTARRRVMWPLLIVAIGVAWLLAVAGAIPSAVSDLLQRAWPALLVLFGFDVLLGRRRLHLGRLGVEMGWIGLALTGALVAVVAVLAYREQADVARTENVQTLTQALGADVARIRVDAQVTRTTVTVGVAEDGSDEVRADYAGSRESRVTLAWSVEGDTGVLTVREEARNAIPRLEDYGRSTLDLLFPAGAVMDVLQMAGDSGDVTADLTGLRVAQLAVDFGAGDVTVRLPTLDVMQGRVATRDGDIELVVPAEMALDVKLDADSGEPAYVYDSFRYDLLRDGELRRRNVPAFQYVLDVWLKDGAQLTITDAP
ncbi:MAG: hypothetical protein KJ047_01640 [Anaerolineae bacterium]|nr:hypothetical protein [Anaerolineae bacterium]MEB2287810.1 hypothetical protein [Anaerolineae bacterium]